METRDKVQTTRVCVCVVRERMIYIYICIYICMYVCVCLSVWWERMIYIYVCVCVVRERMIYIYIYICVCVCVWWERWWYVHVYVCVRVYTCMREDEVPRESADKKGLLLWVNAEKPPCETVKSGWWNSFDVSKLYESDKNKEKKRGISVLKWDSCLLNKTKDVD